MCGGRQRCQGSLVDSRYIDTTSKLGHGIRHGIKNHEFDLGQGGSETGT